MTTESAESAQTIATDAALLELMIEQDPTTQLLVEKVGVDTIVAAALINGPVNHPAPWTREEADAIVAWCLSPMPEGEECTCGAFSPAEAAIMSELDTLVRICQDYGKATMEGGAASALLFIGGAGQARRLAQALQKAHAQVDNFGRSVALIHSWLPQVRGKHVTNAEGEGLYITDEGGGRWVVTAFPEAPGEGWKAVFTQ